MRAPAAVFIGIILGIALMPIVAVSGPLEDALDAYDSGDYATALRLWRPLAEQGNADAQTRLGVMYENGQGVPEDYARAVKWYRLAAHQGNGTALLNLGAMYAHGRGVPQAYVQAHICFNLSASRLPPGKDRDKAVQDRDAVAEHMTRAQIAEAQKLARKWKPRGERAE